MHLGSDFCLVIFFVKIQISSTCDLSCFRLYIKRGHIHNEKHTYKYRKVAAISLE